jgi:hypothetical protein
MPVADSSNVVWENKFSKSYFLLLILRTFELNIAIKNLLETHKY